MVGSDAGSNSGTIHPNSERTNYENSETVSGSQDLLVTEDIEPLLSCVSMYTSQKVLFNSELLPFLLDYIPAVGEVDPFVKITRPDQVKDSIGATILSEPAPQQTDSAILNMHLQNQMKDLVNSEVPVKKLDRAEKKTTEIANWIHSIKLPSASLDVSLEDYVDICLSLIDIPVRKSRIQALHVLFTLFAEFRSSQHFRNIAESNIANNFNYTNVTDRLEL